MSKIIKLIAVAFMNGTARPHGGVYHVDDAEADRVIAAAAAEDVTADFTKEQKEAWPVEPSVEAVAAPEPAPEPVTAVATDEDGKSKKETGK